jgi:hypothetical protein
MPAMQSPPSKRPGQQLIKKLLEKKRQIKDQLNRLVYRDNSGS